MNICASILTAVGFIGIALSARYFAGIPFDTTILVFIMYLLIEKT